MVFFFLGVFSQLHELQNIDTLNILFLHYLSAVLLYPLESVDLKRLIQRGIVIESPLKELLKDNSIQRHSWK